MSLPAVGTLQYDTYVFDATAETVSFQARNVPDSTGRTVAYTAYTIAVRWIVKGDTVASLNTKMDEIQDVLLKQGKTFLYSDRGGGTLSVDAGKDVLFGPIPAMLSIKPLGAGKANECVWQVEFAIPACNDAVYRGQPMEFVYSLEVNIDRGGYSTRTYRARIKVPLGRESGRRLTDSADRWLEQILPPPLPFFRRTRGPASLNEAKNELTVIVTDEEMAANILPAGVVDGQARHTVRSMDRTFLRWAATLTASYEMARDQPRSRALTRFTELFNQRVATTRKNLSQFRTAGGSGGAYSIYPLAFTFEESNIYGRECGTFSASYQFNQPIANILAASALWTPTGTTWDTWKTSLGGTAFAPRGNVGLRFQPSSDVIIDLCLAQSPGTATMSSTGPREPFPEILRVAMDPCPSPIDSWLFYDCQIYSEDDQAVVCHTPLPVQVLQPVAVTTDPFTGETGVTVAKLLTQPNSVVQRRAGETNTIYVTGFALRLCYDISPPQLQSIGGLPVFAANRSDRGEGFKTWVWGNYGHTVMAATWRLRYILPKASQSVLTGISTPTFPGGATLRTGNIQGNFRARQG